MKLCVWILAIAALCAAAAGVFLDERAAYAQGDDNDHVDVALILEFPDTVQAASNHDLNIAVVNHGTRTAYDVVVVVNVVYPEDSSRFKRLLKVPVGVASLENNGYSLRWSIPELGELQREEVTARVEHEDIINEVFDNTLYPHEVFGEVTTASFESDLHKGNNTDRVWSFQYSNDSSFNQAAGNYTVAISVDNPHPAPGDTVNFTITADLETILIATRTYTGPAVSQPIDLKVDIELTGGLTVSGPPTYRCADLATCIVPAQVSYSNGVFNIGTLKYQEPTRNSVTLPVMVAGNAVVNEQCLTAKLTGNPPPGTGHLDDDISDNVAKLCLDPAPSLVVSGRLDAFTVYPCVGITSPPCDSANDIRIRAVDASGVVWDKGAAVIWVHPLNARIYSGHTNSGVLQSVNDGNTVSWQTAVAADEDYTAVVRNGVQLSYSRAPFAGHESGWKRPQYGISARDVDGSSPPPGKVFFRSTTSGNELRKAESPNYEEVPTSLSTSAVTATKFRRFLEFEKLGTYKITWHIAAKRSTLHGSEDCLPDSSNVNQAFCATETYTFHVGPMVDLAVEDGGANPHVADDQNALTIVAVNNGPDDSLVTQVTGLPIDAEVLHISQGAYDGAAGEWNIGELQPRGYYRSAGISEPTLVLGAAAGETASVSIANTKNYEVCVGPKSDPGNLPHTTQAACEAVTNASWNSTPVYDYNASNNTTTIIAAQGAGGVGPGGPGSLSLQRYGYATLLTWQPVEQVYGLAVSHYEVQRAASPWETLPDNPKEPKYLDTTEDSANALYRVRAVNEAGVPGPWTQSSTRGVTAPGNFTATALSDTEIQLSWSRPHGREVTRYEVQYSQDGGNSWGFLAEVAATSEATYTYTDWGLPVNTTRHYRVRGVAISGGVELTGAWSAVRGATTAHGIRAPGLTASAAGQDAIDLSWTVMAGATGYQLQASSDGGATWTALATINDPSVRTYTHRGLQPGATFHYRVRATDSGGGDNPWSNIATATTFVLGVPAGLRAESTQPTTIALSWTAATGATGYEIQVSPDAGATWNGLAALDDGAATTYTHQGLTTGVTRHYRVRATGAGNSLSAWSNVAAARTRVLNEVPNVRVVQKPGYNPAVLEWPTLEDPTITGYEYWRSDYPDFWTTLTEDDRYYGTGSSDPDRVYIQPDHLTAYCVCSPTNMPPYEPFLYYSDWVGSGIEFRVRILRAEGSQNAPPPTPPQTPGQNAPGGRGLVGVPIPADSSLIPAGVEPGDSFRLLFVTSATTTAESADIADYNAFARARAAAHSDLSSLSGEFTALISTGSVNIKDNTATTGPGAPIHWLGGDKVADDYADLYDGDWDSVSGKTEMGGGYTGLVWTGGSRNGETSGLRYAGAAEVRLGDLSDVTLPLSSPNAAAATEAYPIYVLSPVLTVAAGNVNTHSESSGGANPAEAIYATFSGWVSEVGAGIRSLWDAVARFPANLYRNLETAGAGLNPSPRSAAVWDW